MKGRADCLADWIEMRPARCIVGNLYTPGIADLCALTDDVARVTSGYATSWSNVRLILQLVLSTAVATEYGVLDYSAGLRAALQQPLWQGAYAEVCGTTPIYNTPDYRRGRVYANSKIVSAIDRILLYRMSNLPISALFDGERKKR